MTATKIAQVRRLMSNDERVGMGFNSDSGLAVGTPFEFDDIIVEVDPDAPGQVVFSTITLIDSHEQLMESLSLAVDAQGRYGFFSADLKAQFAESTSYNSTSTFMIAKVIVENPFKRGRGFALTPDNENMVRTQKETFTTAFGDSFVRGIQTGGEFYSVIRLTSVSTTTQTDLAIALQAEYQGLVTDISFEAQFQKANSSARTRSELSAMMFQRAGIGSEISPTKEFSDVLARVKQFPTIVNASPTAYEIEVATYDTLPLPLPTPEEEESFDFALRDASDKKLRFIQARNDLDFARQHPVFFVDLPADEVLVGAIESYTKLINEVTRHGIDLSTGTMDPPQVFDPSLLLPPLVEPAPIALTRAPSGGVGVVRIPNLVGADIGPITELVTCLSHGGTLPACLAGTAFTGEDNLVIPIIIDRDTADFLHMALTGALEVEWIPADPEELATSAPGPTIFSIEAQDPPGGTEIPLGSKVTIQISSTPV